MIDKPLRAYHSLYQVSYHPPADRWIYLSALVSYVNSRMLHPSPFNKEYEYSSLQYWHSFEWNSNSAVYYYSIDGAMIRKTVFVDHSDFKTYISFELVQGQSVVLKLFPCLNNRNIDTFEQNLEHVHCEPENEQRLAVDIKNKGRWYLHHSQVAWHEEDALPTIWYPYETVRDQYIRERVVVPGYLTTRLTEDNPLNMVCSLDENILPADALMEKFRAGNTRDKILVNKKHFQSQLEWLMRNLQTFLVEKEDGRKVSVLAGYPWFRDWGRDTMVVMRGLLYCIEKTEVKKIFDNFLGFLSRGMIPNCFDPHDAEKAYYNTIDATLWLFIAVYEYYRLSGDKEYIEKNFEAWTEIIESYAMGTRWGIKVEEDGLLSGGNKNTQLTWMDVKIGEKAVTPRMGKAVEMNALWYNALKIYRFICQICNKNFTYNRYLQQFERNFLPTFFVPDRSNLADWVSEGEINIQNRPNQLFCLALPFRNYLPVTVQQRIFKTVTGELLTPYGIRSLSPRDSQYRGYYGGDRYERDSAYHQGTIWPWLMGTYIDAYVNTTTDDRVKRKEVIRRRILPLLNEMKHGNVGSIAEVYSGDPPHEAGGCFAQAWSVSELVRIIYRYL